MLSHFSRVQLCNPIDCNPPGSSVHGILQARILEWVAMPSSRGSSRPRDQTQVPCALAGRFFNTSATWEADNDSLGTQWGIWSFLANQKSWGPKSVGGVPIAFPLSFFLLHLHSGNDYSCKLYMIELVKSSPNFLAKLKRGATEKQKTSRDVKEKKESEGNQKK